MKKILLVSLMMIMTVVSLKAKILFPDSEASRSEVELGVKGIQRLCPTGMWDHWTFRDIMFDRESNTVLLTIQLNSWSERDDEKIKRVNEDAVQEQAEWIVSNFKAGYEELLNNPSIQCDGDFMLYLSVGTLFKQMERDGVKLRIMLLKPDYINQVFGDIPLELSSEQLKEVKPKD